MRGGTVRKSVPKCRNSRRRHECRRGTHECVAPHLPVSQCEVILAAVLSQATEPVAARATLTASMAFGSTTGVRAGIDRALGTASSTLWRRDRQFAGPWLSWPPGTVPHGELEFEDCLSPVGTWRAGVGSYTPSGGF